MPRFFVNSIENDVAIITGNEADHISKSLRMKKGDELTLCDTKGFDYSCVINDISDNIICKVISKEKSRTEPDVKVTLFQAMPKLDKLDYIIQKSVELGVYRIVPILTKRCVSRPDEKSMRKKAERYSKISLEAAKQSGRGIIPEVCDLISFREAVNSISKGDLGIIFYEGGGKNLSEINLPSYKNISIFIGSEGGFDEDEVFFAESKAIEKTTLGPRILRCETAPVAALSIIMNLTNNM